MSFEVGLEIRSPVPTTFADLDLMKQLGATWCALPADMHSMAAGGSLGTPTAGFDYSLGGGQNLANNVIHCVSIGLKVCIGIMASPSWITAVANGWEIPQDATERTAYAALVTKIVTDLHVSVDAWQIWNEPNHGPFNFAPRMATIRPFMREMVLAARAAGGRGIMPGGPASASSWGTEWVSRWDSPSTPTSNPDGAQQSISQGTYLDGLYGAGGIVGGTSGAYADAIAIHGYTGAGSPLDVAVNKGNCFMHAFDNIPGVGTTDFNFHDDILTPHGDGAKKIWQTEAGLFGGFTGGNGVPALDEGTANNYMLITFARWRDKQIAGVAGPYFYFELRDQAVYGASSVSEDYLGLYRKNGDGSYSAKAQLEAFQALNTTTPPPPPPPPPPPGGGVFTDPPTIAPLGVWAATLNNLTIFANPAEFLVFTSAPDIFGWDGVRSSDEPRPSGHGAISLNPDYLSTTNKDFEFLVNTYTTTDALAQMEYLANAWKPSNTITRLDISTPIRRYYFYGRPRRFKPDIDKIDDGMVKVVCRFEATDPLVYGDTQITAGGPGAVTGGFVFPHGFPQGFGAASAGGVVLNNIGNVNSERLTLRIDAPSDVVNPRVELITTGEYLDFNLTIAAGNHLLLDFFGRRALLNSAESRSGSIRRPGSKWFSVPPGSHQIRFSASAGAPITATFRPAWIL